MGANAVCWYSVNYVQSIMVLLKYGKDKSRCYISTHTQTDKCLYHRIFFTTFLTPEPVMPFKGQRPALGTEATRVGMKTVASLIPSTVHACTQTHTTAKTRTGGPLSLRD